MGLSNTESKAKNSQVAGANKDERGKNEKGAKQKGSVRGSGESVVRAIDSKGSKNRKKSKKKEPEQVVETAVEKSVEIVEASGEGDEEDGCSEFSSTKAYNYAGFLNGIENEISQQTHMDLVDILARLNKVEFT